MDRIENYERKDGVIMHKTFSILILSCFFFISYSFAGYSTQKANRQVIVLLKEPPACNLAVDDRGRSLYKGLSTRKEQSKRLVTEHRTALESHQKDFEARLKKIDRNIQTRHRFTGLINALSLDVPAGTELKIQSMPDVVAIAPNRIYKPMLNLSNDLMNVPAAWNLAGGDSEAGRGIRIGIIDTGIDKTHVMFEDEGFEYPEGFPLGDSDFTNKKIIVARVFPGTGDALVDSTPRDRDGHGTHVASCAAGNANTSSPLGILSGVAPHAWLGNYKVFSSEYTTTEQIIRALEACVEDGMDVVNLSLGGDEYVDSIFDPEALAVKNAIHAGVVIVAAGSNSGAPDTIGSPGQIAEVITVGALTNAHDGENSQDYTVAYMDVRADGQSVLSNEKVILAIDPDVYSTPLTGRFPLVDADVLDGGSFGGNSDGLVCSNLPSGSALNRWVLVQRGNCNFSNKIDSVQQSGGLGALIYNSAGANNDPDQPFEGASVPGTEIPSYHVSRNAGLLIKDAIADSQSVEVEFFTLKPSVTSRTPLQVCSFSSPGPSLDYSIKPDLLAVGQGSYGATQNDYPGQYTRRTFELTGFDISGFSFNAGTSFATPRVAGAAALVKQTHPEWTPAEIKSALVLSAARPASLSSLSSMTRGGGHVNAGDAVDIPVLALPATLSFGRNSIAETAKLEKTIHLENVSVQNQTITLTLDFLNSDRILSSTIEPSDFILQPSESIGAQITLDVVPPERWGVDSDVSGDVLIHLENRDEPLRVPVWARLVDAPDPTGRVLLIDDDSGDTMEDYYTDAIANAGYESTLWQVREYNGYPPQQFMQQFQTVVWFMAKTSLNAVSEDQIISEINERTRFNVELTRYLSQGGSLLLSGMDWSDQQTLSTFGGQVLHVSEFAQDPFITYGNMGTIRSQITSLPITPSSGSPLTLGIGGLTATFNTNYPNMADLVDIDQSGVAFPVLETSQRPGGVMGVAVESNSYRSLFYSFPLERISGTGMNSLMKTSLDWLTGGTKKALSILSVDPSVQQDRNEPLTVSLTADGINYLVGYTVYLNDLSIEITSIDRDGRLEFLVPAGLSEGDYDLTVESPDGQSARLAKGFRVLSSTEVCDWSLF